MAAEDANLRNWRFGTFGDLATRVRNYAARGREGAIYGRAILLGLGALEWEERAQHPTLWRFVTLYYIVSQTEWVKSIREVTRIFNEHGIQVSHSKVYQIQVQRDDLEAGRPNTRVIRPLPKQAQFHAVGKRGERYL